jgi:hypothetical protein
MARSTSADPQQPAPAGETEDHEPQRPAVPLHDPFDSFDFAQADGSDFR